MFKVEDIFAERIGGKNFGKDTTIYKFEKIKRAKRAAMEAHPGVELLDMGVGEPDDIAYPLVIERLRKEADRPENRGYADNGIGEFKEAAAKYMEKVFGVAGIDPATEVIHSIGSKPALAMLPLAFINPGDVALMTTPGYPVFGTYTKYLGGEVYQMELTAENGFLPDLDAIPADICKRAKAMVLNYPNNPTGRGADPEFFKKAIAFAKEHNIVLIHDTAYAALTYGSEPFSFLSLPGAKDVGIELHSLSKAYNMTGWRIGFVTGNPQLVEAYGTVKDNTDSGQFIAIQKAACEALNNPQITREIAAKYERRLKGLVEILNGLGFAAKMPDGTFFLYVKAPQGTKDGRTFANAEEFSQYLIREKLISTVPFDDAGSFVRFSATFVAKDQADEKRVLNEIKQRLSDVEFVF